MENHDFWVGDLSPRLAPPTCAGAGAGAGAGGAGGAQLPPGRMAGRDDAPGLRWRARVPWCIPVALVFVCWFVGLFRDDLGFYVLFDASWCFLYIYIYTV